MAGDSFGLATWWNQSTQELTANKRLTFSLRLCARLSLICMHEVETLLRVAFNDLLEPWTKLKVQGTTFAATIDAAC